jgi:hypothetical protein
MRPWTGKDPTGAGHRQHDQDEVRGAYSCGWPSSTSSTTRQGEPVYINKFIVRRPIFAAGNSDGDFEMLQWTTAGTGPRFGLIVHHTDAEREYAYDRQSSFGRP